MRGFENAANDAEDAGDAEEAATPPSPPKLVFLHIADGLRSSCGAVAGGHRHFDRTTVVSSTPVRRVNIIVDAATTTVATASAAASVIHARKTTPCERDEDDIGPTVRRPLGGATFSLMNGTDRRPGHVVRVFYTVAPVSRPAFSSSVGG
jgi:hypothetical protein